MTASSHRLARDSGQSEAEGEESPGTTGPGRLLTAGQGNLTDSATENTPPQMSLAFVCGKGEPVRQERTARLVTVRGTANPVRCKAK